MGCRERIWSVDKVKTLKRSAEKSRSNIQRIIDINKKTYMIKQQE